MLSIILEINKPRLECGTYGPCFLAIFAVFYIVVELFEKSLFFVSRNIVLTKLGIDSGGQTTLKIVLLSVEEVFDIGTFTNEISGFEFNFDL